MIAFAGRNGSGKSTLAKVIAGLLPPSSGSATWNGRDYAEAGWLNERVTMQFQEPTRWSFTVRENVWLGDTRRDPGSADVQRSLHLAGADAFTSNLADGVDTRLGKELGPGSDLSGGQWQRLAMARCFFRSSDLVIFDEPTSAFDATAEARFLSSVRRLLSGRAGVLITHRFSSLRLADRIYVLSDGGLAESGTHDDLLKDGGIYAELYRQQMENLLGETVRW